MAVLLLCLLPYWAKGQQTSQPSLTVANEITTVQVFNRSVVLTPWPYDNVATSIEYARATPAASLPVRLCVENGGRLSVIHSGENQLWSMSHGTLISGSICTSNPTTYPTVPPTATTGAPSNNPSSYPSKTPTEAPSDVPSDNPSKTPTGLLTGVQSNNPSSQPSKIPTASPNRNALITSNYMTLIGLNCDDIECNVDSEALEQRILVAFEGDVEIFRSEIRNDQIIVILSITADKELQTNQITRDIEKEIDQFGDVDVEMDTDDTQKQREWPWSVESGYASVVAIPMCCCVSVICWICLKRRKKGNVPKELDISNI
eukprot:397481_1